VSSTVCIDRHSASRVRSDMLRSSCLILLNAGSIDEVKVNSAAAWLDGRIYAKRVTFDNSAAPVVGEISVSEYINSALIRTSWWDVFLPKDPEGFVYDADGNLTLDGVWEYTWVAESRLRRMEMRDSVAAVLLTGSNPWVAIDFAYDWMGRRIGKTYQTSTSDPATSGGKYGPPILWMISRDTRYVYDGWMLSMSYKSGGSSLADQSFAWGPDLSGGYGGAGGIGGLVAYTDDEHDALNPSSLSTDPDFLGPQFPIYDGNGNVVKMVRFETAGSGAPFGVEARESASYEYGPFGENRSTTGELGVPAEGGTHQGQRNPFRFSTKFTDAETGLLYYGYRYYSPSMGRWINRDPIQERDGGNLFAFVKNDPTCSVDPHGMRRIVFAFGGLNEETADQFEDGIIRLPISWAPPSEASVRLTWRRWLTSAGGLVNTSDYHFYSQRNNRVHAAITEAVRLAKQFDPDEGGCKYPSIIAIGWSNGAAAAIEFANGLRRKGVRVDLGWTVDPVPKALMNLFGSLSLRKPANASAWYNHYQTIGLIHGHAVSGASNNPPWNSHASILLEHRDDRIAGAHTEITRIEEMERDMKLRVGNVPLFRDQYEYP